MPKGKKAPAAPKSVTRKSSVTAVGPAATVGPAARKSPMTVRSGIIADANIPPDNRDPPPSAVSDGVEIAGQEPQVPECLADFIKQTVREAVAAAVGTPPPNEAPVAQVSPSDDNTLGFPALTVHADNLGTSSGLNINVRAQSRALPLAAPFPLDARVPKGIKQQIWADEYVDMALLLKPNEADQFDLSLSNPTSGPALCLVPKKKAKIDTIDTWSKAFNIYMSIYLEKHHDQAKPLLKYVQIVRHLASQGGDFVTFDENVRYLRQSSSVPWDTYHSELYVEALVPRIAVPNPQVTNQSTIPRGYCFPFHSGKFCSGCQFSHMCPTCHQAHSRSKCHSPPNRQAVRQNVRTPYYAGDAARPFAPSQARTYRPTYIPPARFNNYSSNFRAPGSNMFRPRSRYPAFRYTTNSNPYRPPQGSTPGDSGNHS